MRGEIGVAGPEHVRRWEQDDSDLSQLRTRSGDCERERCEGQMRAKLPEVSMEKATISSPKVEGVSLITDRNHLFTPGTVPTVKVTRAGASGTVEDFDRKFAQDEKRRAAGRTVVEHKPKLPEIKNKSMRERLAGYAIEES